MSDTQTKVAPEPEPEAKAPTLDVEPTSVPIKLNLSNSSNPPEVQAKGTGDGFELLARVPSKIELNATFVGDAKCYPKYVGTIDSFMAATNFMQVPSTNKNRCASCGTGMYYGISKHQYSSMLFRMEMAREVILQLAQDPEQQGGIDPFAIDVYAAKLRNNEKKPYKAVFRSMSLCPMCEYAQHIEYAGAKGAGQIVVLSGGLEADISQAAINALTYQYLAGTELLRAIEAKHIDPATLTAEQRAELQQRLRLLAPGLAPMLDVNYGGGGGDGGGGGSTDFVANIKEFTQKAESVYTDIAGYQLTAEDLGTAMTYVHGRYRQTDMQGTDDQETYEKDISEVFLDQAPINTNKPNQLTAPSHPYSQAAYGMPAKMLKATGGFDLGGAEYFGVLLQKQYFTFLEEFSQQALLAVRIRQPIPLLDEETGRRAALPQWTQAYKHLRMLPDIDFWRPMVNLLLFAKYSAPKEQQQQ